MLPSQFDLDLFRPLRECDPGHLEVPLLIRQILAPQELAIFSQEKNGAALVAFGRRGVRPLVLIQPAEDAQRFAEERSGGNLLILLYRF